MSERDLEMGDDVKAAIEELAGHVREIGSEMEIRETALQLAVQLHLKPGNDVAASEILDYAKGFYTFLTADDEDLSA